MIKGDILKICIAACDDNEAFIDELLNFLLVFFEDNVNCLDFYQFKSGKKLLEKIKNKFVPDIIFLDIALEEDMLGTNFGIEVKKINPNIILIYVSSYEDYYKELAQAEPFGFIMKPIRYSELQSMLNNAIKRLYYLKKKFIFTYKTNQTICKIDLKEVVFFESKHRIVIIHTINEEEIKFYGKLDKIENEIEEIYPCFLRPNKSHYINYHYIEEFSNSFVKVNGMEIKITPKYNKKCMAKIHYLL